MHIPNIIYDHICTRIQIATQMLRISRELTYSWFPSTVDLYVVKQIKNPTSIVYSVGKRAANL